MKRPDKKTIIKIMKIALFVTAVFFIARYFYKNREAIAAVDVEIKPLPCAISLILYMIYNINLASLWHVITVKTDARIAYPKALCAYLTSILGKYIPGKVFMLAARFPAYDEQGVPLRKISVDFVLENICTLLGAGFLFLVSLLFFPAGIGAGYIALVAVMMVAFFVCIHPKVLNFFLRLLQKLIKKDDLQIPLNYIGMLKIVLMFIANWALAGFSFYMMVNMITPIPPSHALYVGGVFGLSVVVGIVSLFAPSGIGVRETVMVLALTA
ncbi:MAG: flippase-like domain-containing protein, partial [Lachnospiraceae bacterium]|nr:flippase-like domain-containing protein [Lachnospiraceae bacterium]